MLQNADDARATCVNFLLDKAQYPTQSLMAPTMEPWQGPSLCVYNNAIFTNNDFRYYKISHRCFIPISFFRNLSTIGQDRKLDRPGATGRFGLGFNAVYVIECTFISFIYLY